MELKEGRVWFAITSSRFEKREDADEALELLRPTHYSWEHEGPEPVEAILYDAPPTVWIDDCGTLHWDVPEGATDAEREALRPRKVWQGMLPARPDRSCAECGIESTIFEAPAGEFEPGARVCLHCHMEFEGEGEAAA